MMFDFLANMLGQMFGELFGESLERILDRRALHRELATAVKRAEERFAREYRAQDAALADALVVQTRFADLPSVQAALRDLVTRPFHDPAAPVAALQRSFADVLPERVDRERVDAAVRAFLHVLGQEVLYIPQLQQLYTLAFQRTGAESSRKIAEGIQQLRAEIKQLPTTPTPAALPTPARPPTERSHPWHNLPQRTYARFVGRKEELEKLTQLLLPYPRSRHFLVTLDGIGGVGKSALAIELAYRYRDGYDAALPDERFAAIVWVSAKRTLLTASGVQQRQQTFSTLSDLYREIATVLEQPAILQADMEQRRGLVERALAAQRTLLIVDNLETVDDEELLTFLRELPDPTKAIVTTRHRIDIAYAIRLAGMPQQDAQALMIVEAARKNVVLPPDAEAELYRRTGGIPLAIVWSIALMSIGHTVESVLRRLGSGHSDIARFCFQESIARIRDRDAYKLLLALALFERSVSRAMLGEVAGLGDDVIGRDDGLAELLQLSLIEQKGDRFKLLPLTQSYVLEELAGRSETERELRERWVAHLTDFARPYPVLYWRRVNRRQLRQEGVHLVSLAKWCEQVEKPDILLQIFPALTSYYDMMGQWDDLFNIAQAGLEYARLTGDLQSVVFIEMNILSRVFSRQDRLKEAEASILDALNVARQIDDVTWQCYVLLNYSKVLRHLKLLDRAMECCQQAIQLAQHAVASPYTYLQADIEFALGEIARDRGDWQAARTHFVAYRDLLGHDDSDPATNLERSWGALPNLAYVAQQMGNLDDAVQMYQQSLIFSREIASRAYTTKLLIRLAALEGQRGNHAAALEHAREALDWSQRLGMVRERAQAEAIVGRLGGGTSEALKT